MDEESYIAFIYLFNDNMNGNRFSINYNANKPIFYIQTYHCLLLYKNRAFCYVDNYKISIRYQTLR